MTSPSPLSSDQEPIAFDLGIALGRMKALIRSGVDLASGLAGMIDSGEDLFPSPVWSLIRQIDFLAEARIIRRELDRILTEQSTEHPNSELQIGFRICGLPDDAWIEDLSECPYWMLDGTWDGEISFALWAVHYIAKIEGDWCGANIENYVSQTFLGLVLVDLCRSAEGRRLLLAGSTEKAIGWENFFRRINLGMITPEEFRPDPETADPSFWRGFGAEERACAETMIRLAIAEDFGVAPGLITSEFVADCIMRPYEREYAEKYSPGDLTGYLTIPEEARGSARFVARSAGVLAGGPILSLLADLFERTYKLSYHPVAPDGTCLEPGQEIARIEGPMLALLAMERTALNFLQRLSGVASLTARFVAEVSGTKAVILDTRKTTPGWRHLEKYAVRCGGGTNHRIGLYDAVLIKDNHLAWLAEGGDPIGRAVQAARAGVPKGTKFIEVEVDTLDQLDRALEVGPDIILVDNLGPEALADAVRRRDARAPGVLLEASGGVTLATVRKLAEAGVDRISVGALTHSAPALDIGLDFDRVVKPEV